MAQFLEGKTGQIRKADAWKLVWIFAQINTPNQISRSRAWLRPAPAAE